MKRINGKEYSIIGTNEQENIWYMSRETGEEDDYGDPVEVFVVAWGKDVIQSEENIEGENEGILWFGEDREEAFGTFIYKMNSLDNDEEFQKFAKKFG